MLAIFGWSDEGPEGHVVFCLDNACWGLLCLLIADGDRGTDRCTAVYRFGRDA